MAGFFSGGRSDTCWSASCSASCGTSIARAGAGERHGTRQLRQSLVFASPVLSFASAPVLAQVLVSSIGQTRAGFIRDASNHAQTFTTGGDSNSLRYNLSSVDVQLAANQNAVVYDSLVVTIRCRSSHGFPGEMVATLTKLPFLSKICPEEHVLNFTTSSRGIEIDEKTTYFLMFDFSTTSSEKPMGSGSTNSDDEDVSSQAGWSIAGNPLSGCVSKLVEIEGGVISGSPKPPTGRWNRQGDRGAYRRGRAIPACLRRGLRSHRGPSAWEHPHHD